MIKITEYYLNKASYIAIDQNGKRIDVAIDYWNGKFRVSKKNRQLENYAEKLLNKKHRVNYVEKMKE